LGYKDIRRKRMSKRTPLKFKYKNWEGKTTVRKIEPVKMWYGKTKWHPKKQWFLKAVDVDKNAERDLALKDIIEFL
jgi:predicted DNA-binding transcriptional regulator YafY